MFGLQLPTKVTSRRPHWSKCCVHIKEFCPEIFVACSDYNFLLRLPVVICSTYGTLCFSVHSNSFLCQNVPGACMRLSMDISEQNFANSTEESPWLTPSNLVLLLHCSSRCEDTLCCSTSGVVSSPDPTLSRGKGSGDH